MTVKILVFVAALCCAIAVAVGQNNTTTIAPEPRTSPGEGTGNITTPIGPAMSTGNDTWTTGSMRPPEISTTMGGSIHVQAGVCLVLFLVTAGLALVRV